jgi:hypothetical protein
LYVEKYLLMRSMTGVPLFHEDSNFFKLRREIFFIKDLPHGSRGLIVESQEQLQPCRQDDTRPAYFHKLCASAVLKKYLTDYSPF